MPKQYLVLSRHGQSEANLQLLASSDGLFYSNSGSDPLVPLTDIGSQQGQALARLLASMFPAHRKLSHVFENEFERVRQFADCIVPNLGYEVQRTCDPRLNKRSYGRFWNLTYKGVQELHPEEWLRFSKDGSLLYRAPDGGENYPDVFARVDDFINELVNPSSENLLVITSSVVVLSFIRNFEHLSDEELLHRYENQSVSNAEIIVYFRDAADEPWQRCTLDQDLH